MSIETIAITAGVVILFMACVLFMITRRVMRLMIRLALSGALIFLLLAGGLAWWYGWGGSSTGQKEKPSANGRGRANSR